MNQQQALNSRSSEHQRHSPNNHRITDFFKVILSGKVFLLLLFLAGSQYFSYGQGFWEKIRQEEKRKRVENRKIKDPIYETGDTLYLFYDSGDSLQRFYPKNPMVFWKLREMTPEEKNNPYAPEYSDLFSSEISIELFMFSYYKRKPKTLTFEELKNIILTSRKEFMDFYQREYHRKKGKDTFLGKESKIILSEFRFRSYFSKVYMIIPQNNNTFKMYVLTP